MLEDNYRSHEELLQVPSELFYSGRLAEKADRGVTHSMLAWEGLAAEGTGTAKGRPLYFFGVNGVDMAELDSPSYVGRYMYIDE